MQIYPVAEVLGGLIRLDTQNPPGHERAAVDYILSLMKGKQVQSELIEHDSNRASLVLTIKGEERGGTVFLGHLDTVPAGSDGWSVDPLDITISGDRAYGRGSSDMKGGVVAILMAIHYLIDNGLTPKHDVRVALTADEECGLMGIKAVRQSGLLNGATSIIVAEPTDCQLGVAEKGALWIRLEAIGEQTHGAMPNMGVNAIEMLSCFLTVFKDKCADILGAEHPVIGNPSVSTTMIQGGVGYNIVPRDCMAVIDIRTTSLDQHAGFLAALTDASGEVGRRFGGTIHYEIINERPALETQGDSPLISALEHSCSKAGISTTHIGVAYYTDLSGLMDKSEKPFAIIGPGHRAVMHKEDEYILISDIRRMAEVYADYILNQ